MLYLGKRRYRLGTDTLRGRIGGNECRMLFFELPEFAKQAIVFGVRDFRIIEDVVTVIVVDDAVL